MEGGTEAESDAYYKLTPFDYMILKPQPGELFNWTIEPKTYIVTFRFRASNLLGKRNCGLNRKICTRCRTFFNVLRSYDKH